MKEYKSNYQQFTYDENLWCVIESRPGDEESVALHYTGPITEGAIVGTIPEGVKNASGMFSSYNGYNDSNSKLSVIPEMPDSLENVTHMFSGTAIKECPVFPAGVKKMFGACNDTPFEDKFRDQSLQLVYS